MNLTITAASTALFSTWVFIEELGLLFDAGDGVSASLGQKSRKIRHIFVTHADRDHLCGLLQLNQLNARNGTPRIYFPKDCGSFSALQNFMGSFDPQSGPASWIGLGKDEFIDLESGFVVESRCSEHVISGDLIKALDYTVHATRRVLKPELLGMPGKGLAALRREQGEDALSILRAIKLGRPLHGV